MTLNKDRTYIPFAELAPRLKIAEGEVVLLTSDVLRLAMRARRGEGGFSSEKFIEGFTTQIGSEGTLLIPAYNFDLETGDRFDIRRTLPMTGSLALAAMNLPDFCRTAHPLHSFLVTGNDAPRLCAMKNTSSFGPDSPFAYLMEKNALMIFVGTTPAEAMTFVHFVEESEQVWYRKYKAISLHYTGAGGAGSRRTYSLFAKKRGWTMKLQLLQERLKQGNLQETEFNGIPVFTIRCAEAFAIISHDIRENAAARIAGFSVGLYLRDTIKQAAARLKIFRTRYGRIRSGKHTG
jgi:aminoglycoside 3-N-acetyltransferase